MTRRLPQPPPPPPGAQPPVLVAALALLALLALPVAHLDALAAVLRRGCHWTVSTCLPGASVPHAGTATRAGRFRTARAKTASSAVRCT